MSTEAHRHFHDELSELKVTLLNMSGDAQAALAAAVEALLQRDGRKAEDVIASDRELDRQENEIEEKVIRLLATQQPMARDLRFLTAAMKIANDLERVGDHAVNIAQSAERLLVNRPIVPEPELVEMVRQARTMLADALDAFVRGDAQAGRAICRRGDGPVPREPQPGARGRPGDEHRRGRRVPGGGQEHQTPRRGHRKLKTILFLCVANAARSQMAEGLARAIAPAA